MRILRQIVVLDAADINGVAEFWAGVLGGTAKPDPEGDWCNVVVDGEWRMGIQLAPDHTPPDWPNGTQQQVHFDIWVDDLAAGHEHVTALGARLLQPSLQPDADEQFVVYADPAGHPFCLCWSAKDLGLNPDA